MCTCICYGLCIFVACRDLNFGMELNVDMVFASFVCNKLDVEGMRNFLGDKGKHIAIISKVGTLLHMI